MMKKERLRYLIDVSDQRKATAEEQRELNAWYASFEQDPGYTDRLDPAERDALRRRMLSAFEREHFHKQWWQHRGYWAAAVAAMVAIVMAAGTWFYPFRPSETLRIAAEVPHDLLPGGNKATLTLADGRTIDLSEAQAGIVVGDELVYNDGSTVLTNGQQPTANGPVNGKESPASSVPRLMSLTTPKGGTYQITLPDGTTVWLNAASTLTYPSHFTGDERVVELEGEAYFDVSERWSAADDAKTGEHVSRMPFKVISNGQQVEVLGTQFNISAYPDEPETQTTLIKGSVRLRADETDASVTLTPGEQGSLEAGKLSKQQVNVSTAIAWKNGDFIFNNEPLESIMRKLARWYDAEVAYEGTPKGLRLYGMVSRSKNISTVLEIMEMTEKVKFKVESPATGHNERRIVVMQ